jgi:beta-lactamase regulating signal transducer with metallopeptidase domain
MISLLVESTIRSLALAGAVGLALQIGRVRDVGTRLAAWTCVLYGALLLPPAIPFLPPAIPFLPPMPVPVLNRAVRQNVIVLPATTQPGYAAAAPIAAPQAHFNWRAAGVDLYLAVAVGLLGRLAFGLMVTRRLHRTSQPVIDSRLLAILRAQSRQAGVSRVPELTESSALAVPITIGWARPSIILPDSWCEWSDSKNEVVLAHELSHVRRNDYATLLAASLYRCLFWFSPLAWWLDKQLRELAEQASDDSALRATADRTDYAEVLLGFFEALQNGRGRIRWQGVAMARGASAGRRIDRILAADRKLSTPARWPVMAAFAALTVPLLYLCGAFQPVVMAQPTPPAPPAVAAAPGHASAQPAPAHAGKSRDKSLDSYIIVSGDTQTMSGSTTDLQNAMVLRLKIGDEFIWFRRDGKSYVIRDAEILKAANKLFEPQHELGRLQGGLGDQQAKLGELMAELGEKQSSVRTTPQDATRVLEKLQAELKTAGTAEELGDVQALLAELQSQVADRQAHIGDQQARLGEEQAKLGEQQAKLGEKQAKLGEEQAKRAEEASRKLRTLIDEAFKKGLVEPEPR